MDRSQITALLNRWGAGDEAAYDQLLPIVYDDLRQIAHRHMRRERKEHTLQPTAIVHEALLRLAGDPVERWENREQFFAILARLMRRVLVEYSRQNLAVKRAGVAQRVPFENTLGIPDKAQQEVVDLDRALARFAAIDPVKAQIVEMRYFAGMSVEEVSAASGLSTATVKRAWSAARLWLHREIGGGD